MIMSLRSNQRLLHTRQNLFCLRQRQPQIGDLGKAGGSIDLYQVDTICRDVGARFDQSQNPTHARSPGQKDKDKDRRIAPGPIPPISGQSRKWRRNGLKRLNLRPEMVWPRERRTHKIWYRGARLTVRKNDNVGRKSSGLQSAENSKNAGRISIFRELVPQAGGTRPAIGHAQRAHTMSPERRSGSAAPRRKLQKKAPNALKSPDAK